MQFFICKSSRSFLGFCLIALLGAGPALASGPVGEHVNNLQAHLETYTREVNWLVDKFDGVVESYEGSKKGSEEGAVDTDVLLEHWEAVDFHAAIETQYVPVYASIWQGIFGLKESIDKGEAIADVRQRQAELEQALWQALGAVKLAAQYQQQGLLAKVQTTDGGPVTPVETLEEIKQRLDRVVAKYAERLGDEATTIVHDTYLHRFEGIEGVLIEQDADLVEDLEKDFNVTLPLALKNGASVDEVRQVVETMKRKLDRAKTLLAEADEQRKDVF